MLRQGPYITVYTYKIMLVTKLVTKLFRSVTSEEEHDVLQSDLDVSRLVRNMAAEV